MIIRYSETADLPSLKKLWSDSFGDSEEYIETFFSLAFDKARCRVAAEDGDISGALYWLNCEFGEERVAYLYAVATAKERRGRGICRALMEDTHRCLENMGYVGAVLVPGEKSLFDMYSKFGYADCAQICEFQALPSGRVAKIKEITPMEYAGVRRELLPQDAVIQEGENIALLSSLCNFYAGEGVAFAASVSDGALMCPELLGDSSFAPNILTSLNCHRGKFRTPGKGKRFAMWRSFRDTGTAKPSYFAFAFD